jgi:hypothetical protein
MNPQEQGAFPRPSGSRYRLLQGQSIGRVGAGVALRSRSLRRPGTRHPAGSATRRVHRLAERLPLPVPPQLAPGPPDLPRSCPGSEQCALPPGSAFLLGRERAVQWQLRVPWPRAARATGARHPCGARTHPASNARTSRASDPRSWQGPFRWAISPLRLQRPRRRVSPTLLPTPLQFLPGDP